MKKKSLNRLSAFFNILLVVLLLLPNFLVSASVFAYDFPSTNQLNKDTGVRPYVEPNEIGVGYIKFNFINNHTKSLAFFEYKIDGNEKTSGTVHPVTGDFIYPGVSVDTRLILTPLTIERTLDAEQYIEIRLALGGERDWDFDWTRFDVLPVPVPPSIPVLEYPIDGVAINDNTPLMQWSDSTDSDGSVSHYLYRVFYNCTNIENIPDSCSVYPNLDGLRVNDSQYQAGTTNNNIYYWQVRAVDNEDNLSEWSEPEKLIIDTQKPVAPQIVSPTPGQYFKSTPILNDWTEVSGDLSEIKEYRIEYVYDDAHTFSGAPYRIATLSNRNHVPGLWEQGGVTIRVQAFDNAGNEGAWSEPVHYFYDATAPVGEIIGIRYTTEDSTNFITNDNTPLIYGTYGDNYEIDTVEVKIGDVSVTPALNGIWTAQFPTMPDGIHTISLKITDKAGNITEVTKNITIDSVAPSAVYTHYIKGELFVGDIAEVKNLSDLSFTGAYTDPDLSSGLKYDSYVIFQAQDDGSFGFAANGKQSYCSWRTSPNLVDLTSYNLTDQIPFTNCIATLPDGEYYMAHQVYDNAVRNDIPSINQFRDVLGLHFRINNTPVVTITTPFTEVVQGTALFTVQADAVDGNSPLTYLWTGSNGFSSTEKSFIFNPVTAGVYSYTVRVTDADGDTDQETVTITVKAPVEQPAIDTPAVQGTTNTITPVVTRRPLVASNVLGTSTEFVQEDTEEVPEVLGEEDTTCTAESVSGHVYMDKDENNIWDQADESFSGIKIKITTKEKDEEKIVEEFLTDEQGAWKTTLCAGTYYISIDTTSIPDGYKLIGDSTVKIDILDDTKDEVEQSFLLSESKTFLQKYWWIILLAILLVTGIVIASSKKEEQQYS